MPTYDYQGRNNDGKLVFGKRLSQSPEILSSQLFREGITPVKIVQVKSKQDYFGLIKQFFLGRVVSLDELGLFSRQMHALLKTGVSITSALRQLADNSRSPQMADALYGIVENLEAGQDLVASMNDYPKIFTPIMISMVRVGMESGRLDDAFLRLNQYLELEASGIKRVKTAFRYPAIIFLSVIAAVIVIVLMVIPTFSKIFAQANVPLPVITRFLVAFSEFIINQWALMLVLIGLLISAVVYYVRSPGGQYFISRYQMKLPVLGEIFRRIVMLRFTQAFAITIESGIPLLEGLKLVGMTINNKYAEQEIMNLSESIKHGKNLTQSAATSPLFTTLELQMLAVSEETGQLSQMLEQMASFYRREVDYDLKKLNDIIEPLLIVMLAGIVLLLAFSVYLPIWDMVKLAKQG